ncbi:MAG: CHAT domain-containing protein [Cyanobacteria bacterium P01_F01_bin.150]
MSHKPPLRSIYGVSLASLGWLLSNGLVLPFYSSAHAQPTVSASNETGTTVVETVENIFSIGGGTLSDNQQNLFHSFELFNLNSQETAQFLSNPDVQNILGRVTGQASSIINGTIEVTGSDANLFLMNPAGFIFGADVQLNVPGDFTATTATGIGFGGGWFNASTTEGNDYALLGDTPTRFAFATAQPGSIFNEGTLAVNSGQTLMLMGGAVVNTGTLQAPEGVVAIAAVPGEQIVEISRDGMVLTLAIEPLADDGEGMNALPGSPTRLAYEPLPLSQLLTGGQEKGHASDIEIRDDGTIVLAEASGTIDSAWAESSTDPSLVTLAVDNSSTADISVQSADETRLVVSPVSEAGFVASTGDRALVAYGNRIAAIQSSSNEDPSTETLDNLINDPSVTVPDTDLPDDTTLDDTVTDVDLVGEAIDSMNNGVDAGDVSGSLTGELTNTGEAPGPSASALPNVIGPPSPSSSVLPNTTDSTAIASGVLSNSVSNSDTSSGAVTTVTPASTSVAGALPDVGHRPNSVSGVTEGETTEAQVDGGILIEPVEALISVEGENSLLDTSEPSGILDVETGAEALILPVTSDDLSSPDVPSENGNILAENEAVDITRPDTIEVAGPGTVDVVGLDTVDIDGLDSEIDVADVDTDVEPDVDTVASADFVDVDTVIDVDIADIDPDVDVDVDVDVDAVADVDPVVDADIADIDTDIGDVTGIGTVETDNVEIETTNPNAVDIDARDPDVDADVDVDGDADVIDGDAGRDNVVDIYLVSRLENLEIETEAESGAIAPSDRSDSVVAGVKLSGDSLDNQSSQGPGAESSISDTSVSLSESTVGSPASTTDLSPASSSASASAGSISSDSSPVSESAATSSTAAAVETDSGESTIRAGEAASSEAVADSEGPDSDSNAEADGGVEADKSDRPGVPQYAFPHNGVNVAIGEAGAAIASLEQQRNDDLVSYFGRDLDVADVTPDTVQTLLGQVNQQTGSRTAIVYVTAPQSLPYFTQKLDGDSQDVAYAEGGDRSSLHPEVLKQAAWKRDASDLISETPLELLVFTLDGEPLRIRVPGVSREYLFETITQFRNDLVLSERRGSDHYLSTAQRLYQWIMAPLEAELGADEVETFLFAMDSGLRGLPIAALHDGEQFVVEKYSVGMVPSLGVMNSQYQTLSDADVLAMGAETFVQQAPLPAVPVEVNTITKMQGGRVFLNEAFTHQNLVHQQTSQPSQIIHLATHASFNPGTAEDSYIQLWGEEQLSLNEVQALGWNNPSVDLLVLSACQTAVGNAEAEMGFAGLAVAAGVRSALASLWTIDDEGTLALMTEFYDQLDGMSIKSEALRQSQLAMLNGTVQIEDGHLVRGDDGRIPLPSSLGRWSDRDLSHPYYWSGFTMIGSPW